MSGDSRTSMDPSFIVGTRIVPLALPEDPGPLTEGVKHDVGKVRFELVPYDALEEVARVLTFGSRKYEDNNWRRGLAYSRLFGAALRHVLAWWSGDERDPETGLHHLAHACCCLLFLLSAELGTAVRKDDRIRREEMGDD